MKQLLYTIINEVNIDDQIGFIRSIIDDPKDQEKVIKQMYMAGNAELKEFWASHAKSKGYNQTQSDAIYKILMDAGAIELLQDCMAQNGIIDPSAILNQLNKPQSLLDLIINAIPSEYVFDKSCISDLISCQPGAGGAAVGPGELLLSFIVKDCRQNGGAAAKKNASDENGAKKDEVSGDLRMSDYGVEIKGNQCLFAGQKHQPRGDSFRKNCSKFFPDIDFGKAATTPWENNFPEMLKIALEANIKQDPVVTIVQWLCGGKGSIQYFHDVGNTAYKDYVECVDELGIKTGKDFLLSLAVAGLKSYWHTEHFDRVLFINNAKNKAPRCLVIDPSQSIPKLWPIFKANFKVDTAIDPSDKHKILPKLTMIG